MLTEKQKIACAKYRASHREERRAYNEAWRKANPEKAQAATAAWRISNKEKYLKGAANYRAKNPEKVAAAVAAWSASNPEKRRINEHNRRSLKNINGGKLSSAIVSKLIKVQRNKCAICKAHIKKDECHIDHIVPLSRGGRNDDKNVQLTCPTCNIKKRDKDPIIFMQEMGYLL